MVDIILELLMSSQKKLEKLTLNKVDRRNSLCSFYDFEFENYTENFKTQFKLKS